MCRKLAMTFIRPTALPYAHLFDVDACSKFVSDYIFYTVSIDYTECRILMTISPTHGCLFFLLRIR